MEDQEERARRERLRELDTVLDALERLNLQEAKELPPGIRETLVSLGVSVAPRHNFSDLIEQIWALQEQFLTPGTAEGAPPRRSGRSGA
jgi:hypothetical protein